MNETIVEVMILDNLRDGWRLFVQVSDGIESRAYKVKIFDHYPTEEEVDTAIAMWRRSRE